MDQREFAERVTAVQGSLYRVAASCLRGESDRLDAVAEAIAKAWEWRRTLREEALFATWITRILIRVCVDIQRRQKRVIPVCEIAEKPAEDERIAALREPSRACLQEGTHDGCPVLHGRLRRVRSCEIDGRDEGRGLCRAGAGKGETARIYRGGCAMKKAEWRAVYAPAGRYAGKACSSDVDAA